MKRLFLFTLVFCFFFTILPSGELDTPFPAKDGVKEKTLKSVDLLHEDLRIKIHNILCSGTEKTSCLNLQKLLDIVPDKFYTQDELGALNSKLKLLDYYESFLVRLEPLKERRHANLILEVVEKKTAAQLITTGMWSDVNHPKALENFLGYNFMDHNFLGRGHFFNFGLLEQSGYDFENDSADWNLYGSMEYAVPLGKRSFLGTRVFPFKNDLGKSLLTLGYIGKAFTTRSTAVLIIGNQDLHDNIIAGFRYRYHSEDHNFIPVSGTFFEIGFYPPISLSSDRNKNDPKYTPISFNLYKHHIVHSKKQRAGVFSWGFGLAGAPLLAFGSFTNNNQNRQWSAEGSLGQLGGLLKYSLVRQMAKGKRSAIHFSLNTLLPIPTEDDFYYLVTPTIGYHLPLRHLNIDISFAYALYDFGDEQL